MRTEDDQALLDAEHTSTIVMLVILIGLVVLPDLFGCSSAQRSSERSAPTTVSTDSVVAP